MMKGESPGAPGALDAQQAAPVHGQEQMTRPPSMMAGHLKGARSAAGMHAGQHPLGPQPRPLNQRGEHAKAEVAMTALRRLSWDTVQLHFRLHARGSMLSLPMRQWRVQ